MIKKAKIKKLGQRNYTESKINLPDSCKDLIEKYNIEMVESDNKNMLSIYFLKDGVDFFSHTIYNYKDEYNLREGFKYAVEKVKSLENDDDNP